MRNSFFFFEFLYSRMATRCFFHSMSSIFKYHLSKLFLLFQNVFIYPLAEREKNKQKK